MMNIKYELTGNKLYQKSNKTIIRSSEPEFQFRNHYGLNEYNRRFTLFLCRCYGKNKKSFRDKKYLLIERLSNI